MKKLLVVLLVLFAGSAAAQSSGRSVEKDYTFVEPRVGTSPPEAYLNGIYEIRFRPQAGERRVSVSIDDVVVSNVPAVLYQAAEFSQPFCGSTRKAVRIVPRKTVIVRLGEGSCGTTNVWGTGTHVVGTVTATFGRR